MTEVKEHGGGNFFSLFICRYIYIHIRDHKVLFKGDNGL